MHIGLFDTDWRGHHTPYVDLLSRYFTNEEHRVTFVIDARHEHLDELPDTERLSVVTRSFPGNSQAPSNLVQSVQDQYFRARQLRTTFQIADRRQFDVLHLLYFDRIQILLRLAALAGSPDVPVIATLHRDAFIPTVDSGLPGRVIGAVTTRALDATLRGGDLDVLTVHSDDIRDRIADAVPSATTANVRTIPAPTPESDVTSDTDELRDELNLPTERDLLLFFGGLRHEKEPDVLAKQLQGLDRPLTVVFAGSTDDFSASDVDAWRRAAGSTVQIVDRIEYIPEEEVDRYFAAADATVLPHRQERGISGPLRRSAMVMTSVIGTADTDVGQLVERHAPGATFDLDDQATFVSSLDRTLDGYDIPNHTRCVRVVTARGQTGEVSVDIYGEVSSE